MRGRTRAWDVHCIPAERLDGTPRAVDVSADVVAGADPGLAAPFTRCKVCPFYATSAPPNHLQENNTYLNLVRAQQILFLQHFSRINQPLPVRLDLRLFLDLGLEVEDRGGRGVEGEGELELRGAFDVAKTRVSEDSASIRETYIVIWSDMVLD